MKIKSLVFLALSISMISGHKISQNISQNKKMKILNEVIDVDEDGGEQEKTTEAVQITFEQLVKEDDFLLQGFDQLIDSANRNAGMGSMNVEMAKAQL